MGKPNPSFEQRGSFQQVPPHVKQDTRESNLHQQNHHSQITNCQSRAASTYQLSTCPFDRDSLMIIMITIIDRRTSKYRYLFHYWVLFVDHRWRNMSRRLYNPMSRPLHEVGVGFRVAYY